MSVGLSHLVGTNAYMHGYTSWTSGCIIRCSGGVVMYCGRILQAKLLLIRLLIGISQGKNSPEN